MRIGAPGMAMGAGALVPPENPAASSGGGAIGAPRAPVSVGGDEVAAVAEVVPTRDSCDAQAASSARAGSSRNLDGIGMIGTSGR
jgi:hypothetical protein